MSACERSHGGSFRGTTMTPSTHLKTHLKIWDKWPHSLDWDNNVPSSMRSCRTWVNCKEQTMNPSTLQTNYNPRHLWQGLSHSSVGAASRGGGTPPPPAGSAGVGTGAGGTAPPPPGVATGAGGTPPAPPGVATGAGGTLAACWAKAWTRSLWRSNRVAIVASLPAPCSRISLLYRPPIASKSWRSVLTLSTVSSCCRANFLKINCSQQQETRRVSLKTEAAGDQEGILNRTWHNS